MASGLKTFNEVTSFQHRFKDLQERFMRILEGDESTKEKDIVTDICKEVPAFSSLTTELNW